MRGLSIHDISDALKLSPRQVEALEQDDYEALPGPAFVRGFLRNYARCLGLDPAPLLDEVQRAARLGSIDLSPISNARGDLPVGGTPRSSAPVGLIVLVLLASVLAGWYFDWFRTEAPQVVEGEVSLETELMPPAFDAQTSALTMVEPVASEPVASAGGETPPTDIPVVAPVPQASPPAAVVGPPAPSAAAQATPAPATSADTAAAAPAPAVPPQQAPAAEPGATVEPAPAPPQGAQLAFRFGADSWVEVRDAAGNIVYSGISRAGTSRNVQGKPPFALVVGNAAQVSLEFNGKPVDLAPHTKVSVARLVVQ